ncbi:MAG: hypothetical protein AAFU60_18690, partial [Bacteroidota bacterium]
MKYSNQHLPEEEYDDNLRYQLLFRDGQDKIAYCQCCNAFHLQYGLISIDLKKSGMHAFRD